MKERIVFSALPVPGATVLKVRSSTRLWSYVHEQICVTVVRNGTGRWKARGVYHDITPASLMVMGVGEFHATTAVHDRASFDALFINPSLIEEWFHDSLPAHGRTPLLRSSPCEPEVLTAFRSVLSEPTWRIDPAGLSEKLIFALSGLFRSSGTGAVECAPSCEKRLLTAQQMIVDEYQREPYTPVDIQSVARTVGVDYFWLVRRFGDHFKVSPYQYAKTVRAARARELLVAGPNEQLLTLAAVASRSGYYDYAHMVRDLRQHLGLTPAQLASQIGGWRPRRANPPRDD